MRRIIDLKHMILVWWITILFFQVPGLPTKFPRDFHDNQTTAECQSTSKMQQINEKICLVVLFLSRKKFHAKQICVLTDRLYEIGPRSELTGDFPSDSGSGWPVSGSLWYKLRVKLTRIWPKGTRISGQVCVIVAHFHYCVQRRV